MSVDARKRKVTEIMNSLILNAKNKNFYLDPIFEDDINNLFSTSVWGFREIVLVSGIATLLDSNFKASTNLYQCKPRAVFEECIRPILAEEGIPHRKSGPLNIAKAAQGLNAEWAAQRRPKKVALSVVKLVELMEGYAQKEIENLMTFLLHQLLIEAVKVESLVLDLEPKEDPELLFNILVRLINETPDRGNTPQRIIGYLLDVYHKSLNTGIIVSGHEDSASTTNTTSKKPGDIQEVDKKGEIINIYEVTIKTFGQQRIDDSYASVVEYEKSSEKTIKDITVICKEENCPAEIDKSSTSGYLGKVKIENVEYFFIDIYEWIMLKLILMPPNVRLALHSTIDDYVSDYNTAEKVKILWKELNDGLS